VYGVVGMSRRFNELVAADYGVDPRIQAVVYQPIEATDNAVPPEASPTAARLDGPVRLLFVGRISVRKGTEMLVELSRRLDDLAGEVTMTVVGGSSFWSDYTRGLADLNPRVATYVGAKPHAEVTRLMAEADALLVPSHYEPGGIVVAEALGAGCVVVVSDEVGSAEPLPDGPCRRFASADADAFERVVRAVIEDCSTRGDDLRREARDAAERCFDPLATRAKLLAVLRAAAAGRPIGEALPLPAGEPALA
jgi:glycosyltransferase involved in cell wall biosynthesis